MCDENNLPDTIKHPENFIKSQWHLECPHCEEIIGFDGVFDWSWTKGCFGETKITPMDFDGVVERHCHYLIFETKDVGKDIPRGQTITLNNLQRPKTFTVMNVWGKSAPEKMEIVNPVGDIITVYTIDKMKEYVSRWYEWADKK